MKYSIAILLCYLSLAIKTTAQMEQTLIPFTDAKTEKWGYANDALEIIVPIIYDSVSPTWTLNNTIVSQKNNGSSLLGVIDNKATLILPLVYKSIEVVISDNFVKSFLYKKTVNPKQEILDEAFYILCNAKNDLFEIYSITRQQKLSESEFKNVEVLKYGYGKRAKSIFKVKGKQDKFGLIAYDGKMTAEDIYDAIFISNELLILKKENSFFVLKEGGKLESIPNPDKHLQDGIGFASAGIESVERLKGKFELELKKKYNYVDPQKDGNYIVGKELMGLVSNKGEELIPLQHNMINYKGYGFYIIKNGLKYSLYNLNKNESSAYYDNVVFGNNKVFWILKNNKFLLMSTDNIKGKPSKIEYDFIQDIIGDFHLAKKDNLWYIINLNSRKVAINTGFDEINTFNTNRHFLSVRIGNKRGLVYCNDDKANLVLPIEYDSFYVTAQHYFEDAISISAKKNEKWAYIEKGKVVVPFKANSILEPLRVRTSDELNNDLAKVYFQYLNNQDYKKLIGGLYFGKSGIDYLNTSMTVNLNFYLNSKIEDVASMFFGILSANQKVQYYIDLNGKRYCQNCN